MPADATDDDLLGSLAPVSEPRWLDLFGMPLWSDPSGACDDDLPDLVEHLYALGLIASFDWMTWYSPDRFPAGRGLDSAPSADAVRVITSLARGDRFSDGALLSGIVDGSVPAAINRLWRWYQTARGGDAPYVDRAEYSADEVYRWSFERRWAPGASLCWVGLNPGTGDSDKGPQPTLRRVVSWAKRERCGAVVVVNLFSFRATDPKALCTAAVDTVGTHTDDAIRAATSRARITLAAWGGNKAIGDRSSTVMDLLHEPVCAGITKSGEPRHPLYVAEATPLVPYRPRAS